MTLITKKQAEKKIYAIQNRRGEILESNPQAKVGILTNMKKLPAEAVEELHNLGILQVRLMNVYNNRNN